MQKRNNNERLYISVFNYKEERRLQNEHVEATQTGNNQSKSRPKRTDNRSGRPHAVKPPKVEGAHETEKHKKDKLQIIVLQDGKSN